MGMFDTVTWTAPCPACGHSVTSWQSKDDVCQLETFDAATFIRRRDEATPRMWPIINWYTSCDHCGLWIDVQIQQRRAMPQPGFFGVTCMEERDA